jgi:hypothetical protein
MLKKIICSSLLATAMVTPVFADTDIVVDNFDSYADDTAFQAAWVPTLGNGTAAADPTQLFAGIITSDTSLFPGLQGKGVDHIAATSGTMVNQFGGIINQQNVQNPVFNIAPSATQSVVLSYDIYDGASGNERMSVGLRHINVAGTTVTTTNILEMGFYNSNSADATVVGSTNPAQNALAGSPGFYTGRGYGARVINFGPASAPLQNQPDWQYFRTTGETWGGQAGGDLGFTTEIERTTDTGDEVTVGDIGAGWHTYTATITPDTVTITIDLFRDGLRNTSRTPDEFGVRPGTTGVDAKMIFPVATNSVGFNSLRIGGPSGLSSAGAGDQAFDNISLRLVDVVVEPPVGDADFDNDGDVDGRDFLMWQRGFGLPDALNQDGDADDDDDVDGDDLIIWQTKYGETEPLVSSVAVPEPAIGMMILTALGSLLAVRRR